MELNPGPLKVDFHVLEKRLDDFAIEVRATRKLAQQEKKDISEQLDHRITETTAKILTLKTSLFAAVVRIVTLEKLLAAANITIAELKAASDAWPTPAPAIATAATDAPGSPLPLSNVTSLMGELREREDKNKNAIFFGVKMDGDDQHSI